MEIMKEVTLLLFIYTTLLAKSSQYECGIRGQSRHPSVYIVGGYNTEPGEYPWMTIASACGSFLISDQWVMTAGHCVESLGENETIRDGHHWEAIVGAYDLEKYDLRHHIINDTSAIVVNVSKSIRHPLYEERGNRPGGGRARYDLTLIKLSERLDLNGRHKHLVPLCLPNEDITETVLLQSYCTATGWGGSLPDDPNPGRKLIATSVPMISSDFCAKIYPEDFNSTDMICGGHLDGGHGTCSGDSGGPLQCRLSDGKWYAIGVVSWGGDLLGNVEGCAKPGYSDVYTNVAHLSAWVRHTIQNN